MNAHGVNTVTRSTPLHYQVDYTTVRGVPYAISAASTMRRMLSAVR